MAPRAPIPESLLQLARAQAGAVTLEQCRMAGLPRTGLSRLVAEGLWVRAGRGLYVTHPLEWGESTRQWLALLAGGEAAALGMETAAALQGWRRPSRTVHVVVPWSRRVVQPGPWLSHATRIPFRAVGDPPRTTVERTALDLVRADPSNASAILADAVNSRRTTATRILQELEAFGTFPRRDVVRAILGDVGDGALSVLELMWLREVERAHGLPRGQRQSSSRVGLRDITYGRLVVELDGRLGHTGAGAFRDMHRDNLHLLQGEPTLRFGFHDTDTRPCACAAMVVAVLRRMGHGVDWHSCRRGCVESEALLDGVA